MLLVGPVVIQHINDFIAGREGLQSVFERFDIREEDGTICRITSHQFRHWLNTIADKGGLPGELQTRWLGRQNQRDTVAYQHMTLEERVEWVKAGVRDGEISGPVAEVYQELPKQEREIFLAGQVQAVHITPMGFCIHNFAITPCEYHLNCLRGCKDYLRTKGSRQEIIYLTEVKHQTERALLDARTYAEKNAETARPWIETHTELLRGIDAALAVETVLEVADGTFIQPSSATAVTAKNKT